MLMTLLTLILIVLTLMRGFYQFETTSHSIWR